MLDGADVGADPVMPEPVPATPETISATRRVRNRLTRRMSGQRLASGPTTVLEPLFAVHRSYHPKADLKLLQRAYEVADEAHNGQFRKSGDPYITHPLAVATILADLGMDTTTVVAALLHDTVEDTPYSLEQVTADFSAEIAHLVDGVTKLDKVNFGEAAEAETIRKMVIAMARDPRVLVIKLADRLHNMRTMRFLAPEKQAKKARETLEVLAPLAHRLGMATIKWELEDLAFAILHPKRYGEIVRLVADRAPSRDTYLATVTSQLSMEMSTAKITAEIVGREKHYYSIYQKMQVRGRDFDEIHDLVAVRILVGSLRECYAAMGVVHALWQPMPGRFKDYIAQPRYGVYQSLHTTVIGPGGKPLEVQIRTHEMHHTAEYGIASHWRYKETRGTHQGGAAGVDEMAWMRQLLDWQREAGDPGEFLDNLRYEMASREIFVFTPKGDIITLPADSTPVDLAYAVHTEVGNRCIGAKVNGRLVALERTLDNGQIVEIFTSKAVGAGPSRDWLNFVVSSRAKNKIRQYFAKERRDEAIEAGKEGITKAFRRAGLPVQRMISHDSLAAVAHELGYRDIAALYAAVGESHVAATTVVSKVVSMHGGAEEAGEEMAERSAPLRPRRSTAVGDAGVLVKGVSDLQVKLARCCTPVPGDEILGYITKSGAVSVHREDCTNAEFLQGAPERLIPVEWDPSSASVFLVAIQVEALDRHRLLSDITKTLADEKVNILSANLQMTKDRMAITKFSFEMADPKHLGHLLRAVRGVEGVYDVYRVTNA
ncbi:bifunctional (p)ppGpp synthetase/guanosine-3',5'-bis(diphosphate) 3'-pyrophosphohydrolase [Nakamurella antarctica]|uniref:Bifunctional (P)ppGpp synthetase/guanosine-3',5'-bis(Diphosphate) 3'-pyrophosphohydrolase n=2 Tax=Nakamurella antarctica TaxID=1902245 RepID=A0A3G9A0W5_9ACTN|nr:bifunctional (p)ppGpp synthetase/guanosine-3',5'-bis(diphosphate) 3'-pyrophosphohydrolase [Nakamurella antarctica]